MAQEMPSGFLGIRSAKIPEKPDPSSCIWHLRCLPLSAELRDTQSSALQKVPLNVGTRVIRPPTSPTAARERRAWK
jgi:hypothetical protein